MATGKERLRELIENKESGKDRLRKLVGESTIESETQKYYDRASSILGNPVTPNEEKAEQRTTYNNPVVKTPTGIMRDSALTSRNEYGSRVGNTVKGALKQSAGSYGAAIGAMPALENELRKEAEMRSYSSILDEMEREYQTAKGLRKLQLAQDINYFAKKALEVEGGGAELLLDKSADLIESGNRDIEQAKEGLGGFGQFLVDTGAAGLQFGTDVALGALTGGASVPMFMRGLGGGLTQAQSEGATLPQAVGYGLLSGSVEALTERLFAVSSLGKKLIGRGLADDAVEYELKKLAKSLAKSAEGRTLASDLIKIGAASGSEGIEEIISGVAEPILKNLVYTDGEQINVKDVLYQGLIGATLGLGGGLGGYAIDTYDRAKTNNALGEMTFESDALDDVIATGLESGTETESYRRAMELSARRDAGQEISQKDVGALYSANVRAIEAERAQEALNRSQSDENVGEDVRDVVSRMGDNGAKALRTFYDGESDLNTYNAAFSRFYEAGVSNVPFERVNTEYARYISPGVRQAAYDAGRNDAKISLAQGKENAKFATVYGKSGGLIHNEASKSVDNSTMDALNTMLKAVGAKGKFVESIYGGNANGSYRNGIVEIALDSNNPFFVVAKHEITHHMQKVSPKEYRVYRDYVMGVIAKNDDVSVDTVVERYKNFAAQNDVTLTTEEAMDELVADFTENIIKDEKTLRQFIEENDRNVVQKFFDAIREFLDKIKKAFKGNKAQMDKATKDAFGATVAELEKAEKLWKDMLKATQKVAQEKGDVAEKNMLPDVKFSLNNFGLEKLNKESVNNIKLRGGVIVNDESELSTHVVNALNGSEKINLYIGGISEETKEKIETDVGKGVFKKAGQYTYAISYDDIRHISKHYNTTSEIIKAVKILCGMTSNYDRIKRETLKDGQNRLVLERDLPDENYLAVTLASSKRSSLDLVTTYITKKNKKIGGQLNQPVTFNSNGDAQLESTSVNKNVAQKAENVNKQFSLKIDTDGMNDEAKAVIGRLKERAISSKYLDGAYATYSPDRINREIRSSYIDTKPDYAKSYIAWVSPTDFLNATTGSFESRKRIENEAGDLNLEKLRNETQPIYLNVDFESGDIVGHEGRHRMVALSKAGVERVAVIINARNDDRYNTKPIESMKLDGQRFSDHKIGTGFYLHDALPLSARYADATRQLFTQEGKSVQFSLKARDKEYMAAVNSGDMEKAQKMVDEAAWEAGYVTQSTVENSPEKVFHGTDNKFTVFDPLARTAHGKYFGSGYYFTTSRKAAEWFSGKGTKYYNPETGEFDLEKETYVMGVYLNLGMTASFDAQSFKDFQRLQWAAKDAYNDKKYDSVAIYNIKDGTDDLSTIFVIKNRSQIKSADPVTYDDRGRVIPLSERFKEDNVDIRYSLKDKEYMDAVNNGDMAKVQQMVAEAAKAAGYDSPVLYHGTPTFGFTQVNLSESDDSISFFATDSLETARTYSGMDDATIIANRKKPLSDEEIGKLEDLYYTESLDFISLINRTAGFDGFMSYRNNDITPLSGKIIDEGFTYEDVAGDLDYLVDNAIDSLYENALYYADDEDFDSDSFYESEEVNRIYEAANELKKLLGELAEGVAINAGNYQLYAKTDGLFEIDAQGKRWNQIPFDKYDTHGFSPIVNTRQLASYAKDKGYTGVKITNVFDDGGRSSMYQKEPATVYIFFDPQTQVKSADPVTYDNDGNVIPLSKRFNKSDPDIRYSLKERDDEYLDALTSDTEKAQRMLDEVAREAGYTVKAYHGTKSDFNIFDAGRTGTNYMGWSATGKAFDFSLSEDDARNWGANAIGNGKIRVIPVYLKADKTFYTYNGKVDESLASVLPKNLSKAKKEEIMSLGTKFKEYVSEKLGLDYVDVLIEHGYDSESMYPGAENISVYSPNNIKSAELETYDDDGAIIPLSERFKKDNSDIRYSLKDSNGNKITRAQAEFFKDSKARDADGNLLVMYHGTPTVGFTIFDREYANPEGDVGAGFYFTNTPSDADDNYASEESPDLTNKIERYAEEMVDRGDAEYDEALEIAREKFIKQFGTYEVYLNVKNPVMIDGNNSTILLSPEEYMEAYDMDDFDSEEDYYGEIESLVQDDIDRIVYEAEGVTWNTNGLAEALWDIYFEGGADFEDVKRKLGELYLGDEEGHIVGNEVARIVAEVLGYDGIIDRTVARKWGRASGGLNPMDIDFDTTHIIVFNPNQIKNIDNENPTDNADIRFSLKEPVEETKNLIAIHNVRQDKLLEAIKLGGLPAPSIAITKNDMLHDNFGDISLVFSKDTISPTDRRNKIYSGDAWTPTRVSIEYDVDDYVVENFNNKIRELTPEWGAERLPSVDAGTADVENDSLAEAYKRRERARYAFLKEKGKAPKVVMREKGLAYYISNETVIAVAKAFTEKQLGDVANNISNGYEQYKNAILKVVRDNENARAEKLTHPKIKEMTLKQNAERFTSEGSSRMWIESVAREAIKVKRNKYKTPKELDVYSTRDLVEKKFTKKLEAEFKDWVDENTKGAIVNKGIRNNRDIFTPSGVRRSFKQLHDPYTLSNIVRNMFSEAEKGTGGFGGSPIGAAQHEYASIADVKADSGRLQKLDQSEYDAIEKEIIDDFYVLANKMVQNSDVFAIKDLLAEAIAKSTKQQADSYLKRESKGWAKYSPEFTDELWELKKRINSMPTGYFEAKPQRAVGFNEVLLAVIPKGNKELKKQLEEAGVRKVKYYDPNIEGDRLKKVNSEPDKTLFSLKGTHDIAKDNARLREYNEYLKGQLKRTKVPAHDQKAINKLAGDILKEYNSDVDRDELAKMLKGLYDYILEEGAGVDWAVLTETSREIAETILSDVTVLNDEVYQQYKDLRNYLKRTKIYIPEANRADITDGYNEFRKRNFGRFTLSNDGTPIDTLYAELADMHPELFDVEEYTTPGNQIMHIADVLDSIKPVFENPYSYDMDVATEFLAREIIDRYFAVPQTKPTFADKQAKKLEKQKYKDAQKLQAQKEKDAEKIAKIKANAQKRINEAIKKEKAEKWKKVEQIKTAQREKEARMSDRKKKSVLIAKIRRHTGTISKMLLNPTDTSHVPEALRVPVSEFLAMIDLSTDRLGDKAVTRLDDLRLAYENIAKNGEIYMDVDPDLIDNIEQAKAAVKEATRISDLNLDDLEALYHAAMAVERSIYTYNRVLSDRIKATITEYGERAMGELATNKEFKGGMVSNLLNIDMVAPADYFEELGGAFKELYADIRHGLDTKIRKTVIAREYIKDLLGKTDANDYTKPETYKLGDKSITLTKSQVMSLYLLSKQDDAQEHIYIGGIKAAPIVERKKFGSGVKITRAYEKVNITPMELAEILGTMTAEEKRIADGIGKFFTDYTAEWGNEVSEKLYGYKKFTVKNYFPIVVDRNYLTTVFGETTDATLKNMGITKARVKGARNPVIIEDIFDVYARQVDQMSSYNAFVIPLMNIQRVYNYRTPDGSVKQAIQKKYGSKAQEYFANLMVDINGGAKYRGGSELMNKLISNYKRARVGANLRVIAQQPTALFRATAMIDPKYFVQTAHKKVNLDTVTKYAPIALWKEWGHFSMDTSRNTKDLILDNKYIGDTFMAGAKFADELTWKRIWAAAEAEVKDKHPDLKGEEFYMAVGERFSEVIDKTQVVDSVLHRPQILRTKSDLVKMSVSFMSEPMKSYNMLRTAIVNAKENPTEAAKKIVYKTFLAYFTSVTVNSVITGLIDALRGDEDDKFMLPIPWDDEDDELTFNERWFRHFLDNLANEPMSMIPYVKDVSSMMQGYTIERMDMAGIADLLQAGKRGLSDKYTLAFKVADISAKAMDAFGIPASSIKREVETATNLLLNTSGSPYMEYMVARVFYPISTNKGKYYNIMYEAWKMGDMKTYNLIKKEMIEMGTDPSTIKGQMTRRKNEDN